MPPMPDALALWDALAAQASLLGEVTYVSELYGRRPRKGTLFHRLSTNDWETATRACDGAKLKTIAHVGRALMLELRPCRKCWPAFGGVAPAVHPREAAKQATTIAVNILRPMLSTLTKLKADLDIPGGAHLYKKGLHQQPCRACEYRKELREALTLVAEELSCGRGADAT